MLTGIYVSYSAKGYVRGDFRPRAMGISSDSCA
jgi:hypothetical protein